MEGGGIWSTVPPRTLSLSLPPNSSFLSPNLSQPPAVKVHVSLMHRVLTRVSPSSGFISACCLRRESRRLEAKVCFHGSFSTSSFLCTFWTVASERGDGNAKIWEKKKKSNLQRGFFCFFFLKRWFLTYAKKKKE